MRLTPIELKEHQFTTKFRGLDPAEVERFKETAAEALTEAMRRITALEEELKKTKNKLVEHEEREAMLKDTITTAQGMVDDLKNNARKEGELFIAEARHHADEIIRQGHKQGEEIRRTITQLKRQRVEFENSMKSLINYHINLLTIEEKESEKQDEDADKLKFIKK